MTCREACRSVVLLISVNLTLATPLPAQTSLSASPTPSAANPVAHVLTSRVTINLEEGMTLKQLAQFLQQRFELNVTINYRALDELGLDGNAAVRGLQAENVMLEEALMLVLEELGLTLLVQDVMLVITTPYRAEEHLTTRVYPVGDLLSRVQLSPNMRAFLDYDSLMEVISSTIAPDTWDEVGGAGAMQPYPGCQSLVISQTRAVHRKIRALLETLRAAKHSQPAGTSAAFQYDRVGSVPHRAQPTAAPHSAHRMGGSF